MRGNSELRFTAIDASNPWKCVTHTPTRSSAPLAGTLTSGLTSSFSGHRLYEGGRECYEMRDNINFLYDRKSETLESVDTNVPTRWSRISQELLWMYLHYVWCLHHIQIQILITLVIHWLYIYPRVKTLMCPLSYMTNYLIFYFFIRVRFQSNFSCGGCVVCSYPCN